MAMGMRARDEAERAISCDQAFQNSTGSLRGTRGSTRNLGWLSTHAEKDYIKDLLSRAEYVVWSYDTPIGFVSMDDGEVQRFYVDEHHTMTTSQHQAVLRSAWGEYETIGERRPVRRRRAASSAGVPSGDAMRFDAQDDLMDEVRNYAHPAHP